MENSGPHRDSLPAKKNRVPGGAGEVARLRFGSRLPMPRVRHRVRDADFVARFGADWARSCRSGYAPSAEGTRTNRALPVCGATSRPRPLAMRKIELPGARKIYPGTLDRCRASAHPVENRSPDPNRAAARTRHKSVARTLPPRLCFLRSPQSPSIDRSRNSSRCPSRWPPIRPSRIP